MKKKKKIDNELMNLYRDIPNTTEPTQELLGRILQISKVEIKEEFFEQLICKKYHLIKINGDGNCLFASIERGLIEENPYSYYIIHEYIKKFTEEFKKLISAPLHVCLRTITAHYINRHPQKFHNFISDDELKNPNKDCELKDPVSRVLEYAIKINKQGVWAGDAEIQALLSIFKKVGVKRSIKVFDVNNPPIIEEGEFKTPNHLNWHTNKKDSCLTLLRKNQGHYHLLIEKKDNILFKGKEKVVNPNPQEKEVELIKSKEKEKEKEKENEE